VVSRPFATAGQCRLVRPAPPALPRYASGHNELSLCIGKAEAEVTGIVPLKLTTDIHEASRGLSAIAELLVYVDSACEVRSICYEFVGANNSSRDHLFRRRRLEKFHYVASMTS